MKNFKLFCLASLVLAVAASAYAQPPVSITTEQREQAAAQFSSGKWDGAVKAYTPITIAEPKNASAHYRLGLALYRLKRYGEAVRALETSEKISPNPAVAYDLACVNALNGDKEAAFAWLDKAVSVGFSNLATLRSDTDLVSLRSDPRFALFETKVDKAANPCKFDPLARKFDFWIGNWKVTNKAGQQTGKNDVLELENGCIIEENWTGALGGTGKSFNFYDKASKKWHQVWVDSSGNSTIFTGEFSGPSLVYLADKVGPDGKPFISRLTFTPLEGGKVRQHGERSSDGGKTWQTTFDFIYEK